MRENYKRRQLLSCDSGNEAEEQQPRNPDNLCSRCVALDIDRTFEHGLEFDGKLQADLGITTARDETSSCPLCRLFAAVRPNSSSGQYSLASFPQNKIYFTEVDYTYADTMLAVI